MQIPVNLKDKIQKIINRDGITIDTLHQKLDISKAGLYNIMNNNDCKLSTLFLMSKVLKVPIEYFVLSEYPLPDYKVEPVNIVNEDSTTTLQYKLESCRGINQRLNYEIFELKDELVRFKRKYYKEDSNNG